MNYLAHAYLSFGNKEILLGNMISDFVKGKEQYRYPSLVHSGIQLHRMIDAFTDLHEATKKAKEFFRPAYRLYSGAFVDVAFDHFLAVDKNAFTGSSLHDFSQNTYTLLAAQESLMPEIFKKLFFYMRTENWLYGYSTPAGIHQSFGGLVKRAAYLQDSVPAIKIFEKHYDALNECYRQFWLEMRPYAFSKFEELLSGH